MSSKRISDIFKVCDVLKGRILSKLDEGHDVSIDDVDKIVRESCREVAGNRDREFSTIYAHCTREMDMSAKQFYDSVKEIIAQKGQSLVNRMYTKKVDGEDDDWTIRKEMSAIFGVDFD